MSVRVNQRWPDDFERRLKEHAARLGLSATAVTLLAIGEWIERQDVAPPPVAVPERSEAERVVASARALGASPPDDTHATPPPPAEAGPARPGAAAVRGASGPAGKYICPIAMHAEGCDFSSDDPGAGCPAHLGRPVVRAGCPQHRTAGTETINRIIHCKEPGCPNTLGRT